MSRNPSPEGVAELRALLLRRRQLAEEIVELQQKTKRLAEAEREGHDVGNAIIEKLESMDCASSGNGGWAGRIMWMLDQLERQAGACG